MNQINDYIDDLDLTSDQDLDSFKQLVIADIKGSISEEEKIHLLNNLALWNYNLQTLRRDMELQLSCQKSKIKMQVANFDQMSEHEKSQTKLFINDQHKWRMSALKFLSNIERKALYVKMLLTNS
ncbi:MAG: hypothetical protein ACK5XN_22575 [Bacteroidota bacterium]|jgi:hypothetical protein